MFSTISDELNWPLEIHVWAGTRAKVSIFFRVCVYTKDTVSRVLSHCLCPGRYPGQGHSVHRAMSDSSSPAVRLSRLQNRVWAVSQPCQGIWDKEHPDPSWGNPGTPMVSKVMLNYNNIHRQPTEGKKWGELFGCLVGWFLSKKNIPSWIFLF